MTYPSRPALAFFAAATSGTAAADLAAMLAGPGVRTGSRIDSGLPKRNPETGEPLPLLPCPFAAIAMIDGDAATSAEALRALIAKAPDAIDLTASALLVGTSYTVKAGDGAIIVAMLVRRRAGFTPEAFRARWLGEHAPFGLRIDAVGYRQLHAGCTGYRDLPRADRFDGAGLVYFDDIDRLAATRATPEVARDATRDEMQFIDHGGSMLAMFRLGPPVADAVRRRSA